MFDLSLHNILHSNIFNFVLMVIILYYLCAPIIRKTIQNANEKTVSFINQSISSKNLAVENLETAKEEYSKTPEEKAEISKIAKCTIDSLEKKSIEDTDGEKKIIEDNCNKAIASETGKITSQLIKNTADKSVETALSKIKSRLEEDVSFHNILIERAIDELEISNEKH